MQERTAITPGAQPDTRDTIEVHVRDVAQLFDSLDPWPFYERDLDPDAEAYIVASLRELHSGRPCRLVIYLDERGAATDVAAIERAVQTHFARRAQLQRRDLRRLTRRGLISLLIGLSFLALLLFASELVTMFLGDGPAARIISESLIIGGWVAMWKPLEIFLYDWWPILGGAKEFERLAAMTVRLDDARAAPPGLRPKSAPPAPPQG
jgi:hypothetical protein